MHPRFRRLMLAVMLACAAGDLAAHHSYVSKYDANKVIRLAGTIANVRYSNPHIFFELQVTSQGGGSATWTVETESPAAARSAGLTEAMLKEGARAALTGWPARDGSPEIGLFTITISGQTLTLRKTPR